MLCSESGRGAGAAASSFAATGTAQSSGSGYVGVADKKLQIPHTYYSDDSGIHKNYLEEFSSKLDLAEPMDMVHGGGGGGDDGRSLREQLELVTRERDSLKNNQKQIEGMWKRRVRRLEEELEVVSKRKTTEHGLVRGIFEYMELILLLLLLCIFFLFFFLVIIVKKLCTTCC